MARVTATLSQPLFSLFSLVFLFQVGTGMLWSVIAIYTKSMGASVAMVGAILSSFGVVRLFINIPSGMAAEKFGRGFMMRIGGLCTVAGAFGAAITSGLPAFTICLWVIAMGSSIYATAALTAMVDLGSPERRLQDMASYQAVNVIGISLGPGLGGIVAGLWGYKAPFLFQGIVALCALWLLPRPAKKANAKNKGSASWGDMGGFIRQPQTIAIGLMAFANFFVRVSSNWVILPLIATTKFEMSVGTVGIILTAGAITNLACLPFTPWVASRLGRTRMIVFASALFVIGVLSLCYGNTGALIWISTMCIGAGAGFGAPMLTTYIAETALPHQRGAAMGAFRTVQDSAMILGPSVTGLLTDRLGLGYQGGLLGCLVVIVTATFFFVYTAPKNAS